MTSLRWRIAAWYALLLIAAILALGLIVTLRFEQILYDQAQGHLALTMQDIKRVALPPPNQFSIQDTSGDALLTLESTDNLERWAAAGTYLEIEDTNGHDVAKSFNMGTTEFPPAPKLTAAKPSAVQDADLHGTPFLVQNELMSSGRNALIVRVGEPLDQLYRAFNETRQAIVGILIASVLAVGGLSLVLASQATNPINQLALAMREIGSDRLNRRLRWKNRNDEVGKLAATFDDLLARLEESFARERQFISDASHELKTPLTSINANAQLLARWGDRDEQVRRESLETIATESASLAGMVAGMLTLAKADSGEAIPKETVPLGVIGAEAVAAAQPRAHGKGLRLTFDGGNEQPQILGDPSLIRQLFSNLIDNAIKFTDAGSVTVRVRAQDGKASIEVEDTGPGIDPADAAFVFDRFYRTDKSRNRAVPGTGLGLAIVRSITRVHDGSVEALRSKTGGALFRAWFPRIS
ncbi:MAG TPA: HAMP domain-containing sensor histidine kinase [Candidatus Rubrimentiphilum sp.]|nr:HAMP domain-containing sensor histidine kinase [Candidatus Rubrimentiphilum sp.]